MILLATSCSTFYSSNRKFHKYFETTEYNKAEEELLKKSKKNSKGKNKLLHFLDRGVVAHLLGKYEQSNQYFEKAYQICKASKINPVTETLAYLINPGITNYKPEDHEVLLIHYYKALNNIFLNNKEAALIECRRMNSLLKGLRQKYKSNTKYSKDAFIFLLMGLIYEANGEYNNAFISYREAYKIYKDEYSRLFGIKVPQQLKEDLLYTAYKMGFRDYLLEYEKEFGMKFRPPKDKNEGQIIVLWNTGLGPVKDETSFNFFLIPGIGGVVNFKNDDLGLTFPFPMPIGEPSFGSINVIRVAFPKYKERKKIFNDGIIEVEGHIKKLELVENINKIAFKTLEQRMIWEFSKSLIRLAIKKATEYTLSKQNTFVGLAATVFNAVTEKADTRNWQTLPHSIYYTKVRVSQGKNIVRLKYLSDKKNDRIDKNLEINIGKKESKFVIDNTLLSE